VTELLIEVKNACFMIISFTCDVTNMSLHKVFVYGTLKRGEPNHHWITDMKKGFARFIGVGKTVNKYPLIIATKYNIPFVLDCPGQGHVRWQFHFKLSAFRCCFHMCWLETFVFRMLLGKCMKSMNLCYSTWIF